ncbi:methyltransferase domain-containing protein [Candidatus Woesearchaeota archaeon]|nr:methyltransferase domain-containing protein [Candidatus Woesearchaeota archaeon]
MKTYFDEIAEGYEELHREEQMKKLNIIKENLIVRPGDRMLDVGCGPGFAKEVFDCNVTGLDPSEELLKKCSFKTVRCEAEDIPFPDSYFDVVISVTSIHNFDDYRKGIREMKRVGKSRFVFSILKSSKKFDKIKVFIEKNFIVKKAINGSQDFIMIC